MTAYFQNIQLSEEFETSLLDFPDGKNILTCIQCGWCTGICPLGRWMDFAPRKLLAMVRAGGFEEILDNQTVWMCVSCCACTEVCPAKIPLTKALMTRTKEELLLEGNIPSELQTALENTHRYGNPLGESPRKRADWALGLDPPVTILGKTKASVDVLWFVGDYASYHPRVQQGTRALAKILNALMVNFGILGSEESSDGDSQRLAGEKGLFEFLVTKNGGAFSKYVFNEIITTDPHAYNAIKNEYPELGISYPVRHYTQFLYNHLEDLTPLLTKEIPALVTFHDPCYLGRANGEYEAPRALLEAIPGVHLVEMSHNKSNSLCCGGGGGGMWLDGFQWEISKNRLSEWRVREAILAYPETSFTTALVQQKPRRKPRTPAAKPPDTRILAVACPYEVPRFEDAAKVVREARKLVVKDIAELLAEAMAL